MKLIVDSDALASFAIKHMKPWLNIRESMELLGWNGDPKSPGYKERRAKFNKLIEEGAFDHDIRTREDIVSRRESILEHLEKVSNKAIKRRRVA